MHAAFSVNINIIAPDSRRGGRMSARTACYVPVLACLCNLQRTTGPLLHIELAPSLRQCRELPLAFSILSRLFVTAGALGILKMDGVTHARYQVEASCPRARAHCAACGFASCFACPQYTVGSYDWCAWGLHN